MKKPLHFKGVIWAAFIFFCIQSFSQVPFSPVQNSTITINGELKTIGNTIVGLNQVLDGVIYTPSDNYNGNTSNNQKIFDYIDVDNDQSTFSSSSAVFTSSGSCAKVAYAGLYWAATYFVDRSATNSDNVLYDNLPFPDNRPDFRTLKFKPPGVVDYIDIPSADTQVIFDGYRNTPTNPSNTAVFDIPYVCYTDVTNIIKDLPTPDGTYTVANIRASTGFSGFNTNGISGGWVLVIAYEDNSLSKKYISSQQGYINNQPCSIVDPGCLKSFTYSGFQTAPAPSPVRARYAVATLEGDRPFAGDIFQIERPDLIRQDIFTAPANPNGNFFDSSISVDGSYVTNRTPSSENTLGFDLDIFDIPNPNNTVIGNNQTSSTFFTSSAGDGYSIFFNSIQVEVIEPELIVTERVLDANGIDITGESVNFADQLFYELMIENRGNEDITATTVRDVLPDNVDFTIGSITTSNPGIVATFNGTSREINITVADNLLVQNGGVHTVRFGVQVVPTCADLRDACSNEINNLATYTYTGIDSGVTNIGESILDQDACGFDISSSVNTLINEGVCFTDSEVAFICTGSLDLIADNGFTNYTWTYEEDPSVVFPNTQTITVTLPGTYTVLKTGAPGCQDAQQIFVVDGFTTVINPVVGLISSLGSNPIVNGNIRTCPITGDPLPEIVLCGAGTTLNIPINFPAGTTVIWERLDPAACPSVTRDPNCPTPVVDFGACEGDWIQVSTDIGNYTVEQAGEYRIRATFDSGCTSPFYFNVFQNNFDVNLVVVEQIACGNPGTLRVENASNQYEYQLVPGSGVALPYQASPEFTGLTEAGTYTVNARKAGGLPTLCVFQTSIVLEEADELIVDITVTQPTSHQDLGEIAINTIGGVPPYSYSINNASPVSTNVFTNLIPGNYSVIVGDSNGCEVTQEVTIEAIEEVPLLEYADEILFCAITGRSYPVISIEDQNGEALEVSFNEGASIVWQKLDDISCAITLENDCPTTDSSCSSGWFDINTGGKFNVKEEGEYRIVITFANRTTNNTEIYYFKAENNLPNIADSFMMYPNPSEDIVNVNADVKNIRVFDVMGKLVLETTQNSYSISNLRNGIYFAKIETKDNKEVIVRVVKK
ncbi:T9SS type A sorting domain-containing protein [Aquimarina sp. AU119]|uniref:T9SS type A sorting domain-containing protein n=1 Tax=Aquimarina sp. AU119 TaxID=2108528 RepID=UPI000D68A617|nr:T9SS type A sorting domain-containing protein [Aquimarina sp. AU119]